RPDDLCIMQPPQPAYFDAALQAWVLSRYADVVAALQDSRLRPAGDKERDETGTDQETQTSIRSETQSALSGVKISEWESKMERPAHSGMDALPVDRPIDLVSEVAEPWCTDVAMIVTGSEARDRERLLELARVVSAAAADPDDPVLKDTAAAANSELERRVPS